MTRSLSRAQRGGARLLDGPVDGDVTGHVDHRREALERGVADRLQDLLVAPAGLARLLVEVHRGAAALLEELLDVAQQRRLSLVARVELSSQGDLVEPEP